MCRHKNVLAKSPVVHLVGREGNESPVLKAITSEQRTSEARDTHQRTLKRRSERAWKKAGEEGVRSLTESRRLMFSHSDNPLDTAESLQWLEQKNKPSTRKPASSPRLVRVATRTPRRYSPEALERKKTTASFREAKRVLVKALRFAARQSKKYGHSIYLIILGLFCLRCQDLIPKNLQEGA